MVVKLEIIKGQLIGTRESDGKTIVLGLVDLPIPREKHDPMKGKARWKDGSFLDEGQAVDEKYTKKMGIA